jgi:MATE family multidrug resistance protein
MVRLATPIVIVQLGWMAMPVVDTIVMGRVSAVALAAVALGSLYAYVASVAGIGVIMSLDPIVSQAVGAKDEPAVARALQRGIVLALAAGLLATPMALPAGTVLRLLGQDPAVARLAEHYVWITFTGLVPLYLYFAMRQTLQALGHLAAVVMTMVAANVINLALNWVLVFGHLGAPALGVAGSALATSISRWLMALLLLAFGWRRLKGYLRPWLPDSIARRPLAAMVRIGLPISLQWELEFGAFAVIGLLMGAMGPVSMAGHQVALNLASVTFMVPNGVSGAAAILVGRAVGRGDAREVRRAAAAALVCGIAFMAGTSALMLALPGFFARLYTTKADVAAVAAMLIPIAGFFQVFDGTQVVSIGILRGVGDTRTPMLVNILGFWLVGVPVSWYVGVRGGGGPQGLWWGLTVGLVVVAVVLLLRVRAKLSGDLARVSVDGDVPSA